MSLSFQDLQEAIYLDDKDEFLIYQNSSQRNKRVKRGNLFASKGLTVRGKFIDAESGNDVGLTAATAEANSILATAGAAGAQATADGKNTIFYSNDQPSTSNRKVGDIWFEIDQGYKTYKWNGSIWEAYESNGDTVLSGLNVGKLTSGYISSQIIELANTNAYLQSSSFIESWVSGKLYKTAKTSPSDVIRVKVLQTNGSYKVYNCTTEHTSSGGTFPGPDGAKWSETSVPTISVVMEQGGTAKNIPDLGFRVVGQGQAEFHGIIVRGAIVANEGFFGTTVNAIRLDDKGLTVGNNGYLKSRGVGYNGTAFFATSGTSGGFFLGNTQAENDPNDLYQLFVGNPTGNSLWWNGNNLLINGSLAAFATGSAGTSGFGLTIGSGFGIRYINNSSVLTITGGVENGVSNGAQIDLCGSSAAGQGGYLILQAGSGVNSEIRLNTNLSTDTSGRVGATRLSINNAGLVSIVKSPVATNVYNTGAGNLYVHSNLGVGRTPEQQDASGDTYGRIWASEEVAIYNMGTSPAIRSVVLKKVSGAGMLYLRAGDDSVTVTLDGGTGQITASSFTSFSSKRFKKKIKNLKDGLAAINSLRPVTFDWKNRNKQNDIGLIAEEVNEVLPIIVAKDENGDVSGLDYGKLTPILIQAIKELTIEVNKLKNRIK